MRYILFLLLTLATATRSPANIQFIHFDKIDPSGRYAPTFKGLLTDLPYFDHWSPKWTYPVGKDSLIRELKTCLHLFAPLRAEKMESGLLLGDIAHYLYNLDQQNYYDTAEAYYQSAIDAGNTDGRGYWFLGYHYAQSNEPLKGVAAFESARKQVDAGTPAEFWEDYAFAMLLGGMHSHCQYALDELHGRGKQGGAVTQQINISLRASFRPASSDSSYANRDLWQPLSRGATPSFLSRPLGIRMKVDSTWRLGLYGFANRQTAFSFTPPAVTSSKGHSVGFTIVAVVRAPAEGEKLEDFVATLMKKTPGQKDAVFPFERAFPHGISYSYRDPNIYKENGGAHMHFIGLERVEPQHPGLLLEEQATATPGEPGKLTYYRIAPQKSRFKGRLFYFFLLDTCEDIHPESWAALEHFVTDQLVIE